MLLPAGLGRVRAVAKKLLADQRFRFLLGGGFAAAVGWSVRFPLDLFMPFAASVAAASVIGLTVGFLVYRRFVFEKSDRPWWLQLRDFLLVNIVGQAITFAVAVPVQALLPSSVIADGFAHGLGIACGAVANYIGHARLTFRPSPDQTDNKSRALHPQDVIPAQAGIQSCNENGRLLDSRFRGNDSKEKT